jgi:TonB family protein
MIIGSLAIHVVVFGYALRVAERPHRRASVVSVVGEKKKEKPQEKPKPKPKAVVAPKVQPAAPVPLKNAPAPVPETAPAPVDTHMTLDNSDAPGIDVGPKPGEKVQPKAQAPGAKSGGGETMKKAKVVAPKGDNPEEDTCTEAPSKPVPQSRPSEIEYTTAARENGIEGRLVLTIIVGPDGSVLDVKIDKSVDPSLDAAAIAAVKTWTFKPAMRCGKPMGGGVFRIAKTFELGD